MLFRMKRNVVPQLREAFRGIVPFPVKGATSRSKLVAQARLGRCGPMMIASE